jgi:phage shock protein E
VSAKRRGATGGTGQRPAPKPAGPVSQPPAAPITDGRVRLALIVVAMILATVVVIGADWAIGAVFGNGSGSSPVPTATATASSGPSQFGVTIQGVDGHWTNVTPDELAGMMSHKVFTLVNVKTPYMGEIDGTDLYIPYDQLNSRASELPADKGSRVLVYCRTGASSAVAAQSLLDLGYTNVWNLAGGMEAWKASGRQLVQKNR